MPRKTKKNNGVALAIGVLILIEGITYRNTMISTYKFTSFVN